MRYEIVPIGKTEARQFIEAHHRHNEAPSVMQVSFAVALEVDGVLVAVATAGRPVARGLDDGRTLEVNRVCVDGDWRNGNSALYGSIRRAAKALGYRRVVTYTLESESGVSLRASGFQEPVAIGARSWQDDTTSRVRYDVNLWGERRQAQNVAKLRWEMAL